MIVYISDLKFFIQHESKNKTQMSECFVIINSIELSLRKIKPFDNFRKLEVVKIFETIRFYYLA